MRILIDARIHTHGKVGGVEQFIHGLLWGLGKLARGDDEFELVVASGAEPSFRPFTPSDFRVVEIKESSSEKLKAFLGPLRRSLGMARARLSTNVPESKGFYESRGAGLVHFPHQLYVRSSIPTIYNPHDLQHLHFPGFFSKAELRRRELVYQAGCTEAAAVVADSHSVRNEIIDLFQVDPARVFAIPMGPSHDGYEASSAEEVSRRYVLPPRFALYPAQTWPHKNHLRLFEAVDMARRNGTPVRVVCTGLLNESWQGLHKELVERGLDEYVRFLGFVPAPDLKAMYRMAAFTVYPSLIEGGGLPIMEAMSEGCPVTCSDIAVLRELAGEAATFFDPSSPEEIASCIGDLWEDPGLGAKMRRLGQQRAKRFSWRVCALTYTALYRSVGGLELTAEQRSWLDVAQNPHLDLPL